MPVFIATLDRVEKACERLESFDAGVAYELRFDQFDWPDAGRADPRLFSRRKLRGTAIEPRELERLRTIIFDMLFLASPDQGSKAAGLSSVSLVDEVATTLEYLDHILQVSGDAQVRIDKARMRRADQPD